MKKLYALILCVLLVGVLAVTAFAAGDNQITVTPSATTVYRGDEVTVVVSMTGSDKLTSFGYMPASGDVFEVISGSILATGAFLADFSAPYTSAVLAYGSETTLNGDVLTYTIKIKDDAPFGEVNLTSVANMKNGANVVDVVLNDATITVACKHDEGTWTDNGENHIRTCSICGDELTADHTWDDGTVTTEPTCVSEGVMTYACACGAEKTEPIAKNNDHSYGIMVGNLAGQLTRQCTACGEAETWSYASNQDGTVTVTGYSGTAESTQIPYVIAGKEVSNVASDAFAGCSALKTVYYTGTQAQWTEMAVVLENVEVSCDAKRANQVMAVPDADSVFRGGELSITVYAYGDDALTSLGFIPEVDGETFQITGGECLATGAAMADFSVTDGGAVAFNGARELNGSVFRFTVQVSQDAAFGEYQISGLVSARNSENAVVSQQSCYGFAVVCDHAYSAWTNNGEDHSKTCSICGDVQTAAHAWDAGSVTTEPTCKDEGVKTYTCTDCGASRTEGLPVTGVHSYGEIEKYDDDNHIHVCQVCAAPELLPHTYEDGICTACGNYQFWKYTIENGKVTIDAYVGPSGEVKVLETIEGLPVEAIGEGAFAGYEDLRSIVIHTGITEIGKGAFEGCDALKNVYYEGNSEQWDQIVSEENAALDQADAYCDIQNQVAGNFNDDGEVADSDAIHLLRHTLFPDVYAVTAPGDVNNDGLVNDADAVYLLRHTLFPDTYPLYPGSILNDLYIKD